MPPNTVSLGQISLWSTRKEQSSTPFSDRAPDDAAESHGELPADQSLGQTTRTIEGDKPESTKTTEARLTEAQSKKPERKPDEAKKPAPDLHQEASPRGHPSDNDAATRLESEIAQQVSPQEAPLSPFDASRAIPPTRVTTAGDVEASGERSEITSTAQADREAYDTMRRMFGETSRNWRQAIERGVTSTAQAQVQEAANRVSKQEDQADIGRLESLIRLETSSRQALKGSMEHEVRRQVQTLKSDFDKKMAEMERRFREFFSR